MRVEMIRERGRVREVAESPAEAKRLAAEARVLALAAHPGVVRILEVIGGDPPSELVLEDVDGVSLTGLCQPLTWPEVAGLGAALSTTLGDLHDIGVVHRSVTEQHVVLDGEGRPVLSGFGNAAVHSEVRAARLESAEDVTALVNLLLRLGPGTPPRPLARVLRTRKRSRLVALDARQLARGLMAACPDARLPDMTCTSVPDDVAGPDTEGAARSKRGRLAAAALLVTACTVSCLRLDDFFSATTNRTGGCTARSTGCASLMVRPGSVISGPSGDFQLVGATGTLVIGRWHCASAATPAVLDLPSGDVWVFDRWPLAMSGNSARLAGRVRGATGLEARPASRRGATCDRLFVERHHARPVGLRLR